MHRALAVDESRDLIFIGNDNAIGLMATLSTFTPRSFFILSSSVGALSSVSVDTQAGVTYWGTTTGAVWRVDDDQFTETGWDGFYSAVTGKYPYANILIVSQ
jgi:hypothetical protein